MATTERGKSSRFANLSLELSAHAGPFRVLDISHYGCRSLTPYARLREQLPPNQQSGGAIPGMGRNVRFALAIVVPRTISGKAVGVSFAVGLGEDYPKRLLHEFLHFHPRPVLQRLVADLA
jgi:hypothetical protein